MKNRISKDRSTYRWCQITVNANLSLNLANNPIVPCIKGNEIGADIQTEIVLDVQVYHHSLDRYANGQSRHYQLAVYILLVHQIYP